MAARKGRDLFFEVLQSFGVTHLFGNPGTTELPIMDGLLSVPDMRYVLAMHENIAVGAAMGHALATGRPGVVNLHGAPGLAHGMCNVHNANASGIPLIVTVGQQDTRGIHEEPVLWAPVVEMARPITKWAYEVRRIEEMQPVLERAFLKALTPPQGPVLLSLPHDVLWDETDWPYKRPGWTDATPTLGPAPAEDIEKAFALLREKAAGGRGMMLVGDEVKRCDAAAELIAFAERTRLDVYHEALAVDCNFPNRHPLFRGMIRNERADMRRVLSSYEFIVFVGFTSTSPYLYFDDESVYPEDASYLVLTTTWRQAEMLPAGDVTVVGDLKRTLSALNELAGPGISSSATGSGEAAGTGAAAAEVGEDLAAAGENGPMSAAQAVAILDGLLPKDAVIFNEAVSEAGTVRSGLAYDPVAGRAHGSIKGGGLGYSSAMAIGYGVSRDDRRPVNIIGDGSMMYYPQALWTAAHYDVPVLFVILNNKGYRILKQNFDRIRGGAREASAYPATDLTNPAVNFALQAEALGVQHERAATGAELMRAVEAALADTARPRVVEVAIG